MATQAKSNIAVSNDCTSGVFTPNAVITINGTDRTSSVQIKSVRVNLARNEQPDSAEFIINRDGGFTPTAGQSVGIGLGDYANYLFAGQIDTIRHERIKVADSPDYAVTCIDWSRLFNRRLITADFSGQSATTIATSIVTDYTTGFYTYAIESGLATIDEFPCINEEPLTALARLAALLGGGCHIDTNKIVHLWDSAGPTVYYAPSAPETLTNSLSTLKRFVPEYDWSQVRTRAIVDGRSTQALIDAPVGATSLPIEYGWMFNGTSGGYARIGAQVVTYARQNGVTGIVERPGAVVAADVAVGDTSLTVDSTTAIINMDSGFLTRWLIDANGNLFKGAATSPTAITGIPASGEYGQVRNAIVTGTPIYAVDALWTLGPAGLVTAISAGEAVTVRVVEDDSAAQTAIAAIEGGDGIHEHATSDGELSHDGCTERALAELATFSDALLRAEWVTHDPQAVPGAQQVINLSSPAVLSTTLTIDSVLVEFPVDVTAIASSPTAPCASNLWPRRTCHGSTVKLETILDAIKG